MAASTSTTPITIKDIEDMEARGSICEIVNGQWVHVSEEKMAGELHGAIGTNVIMALGAYVKAHKLGRVYPADTTYILEEDAHSIQLIHLPDVSFVAANRMKTHERHTYYQLAPDIAIEIISPSERAVNIRAKLKDYLRTGARQVWHIIRVRDATVSSAIPGQKSASNMLGQWNFETMPLSLTCEGQSRRRLSLLRLNANTAMLRTACFLCVIGHRELLNRHQNISSIPEGSI